MMFFEVVHDINGHTKADHAPFSPAGEQRAFNQNIKNVYSHDAN